MAEVVFAYLTDPAKLSTWQDVEEVSSSPRGRRFDIRMVDGPPLDGRWDLEPSAAGTRLTFTPIVRPAGVARRFESESERSALTRSTRVRS